MTGTRTTTTAALAYPVLGFSQGHVITVRDEETLTTAGKRGLKSGWFDKLYLVDADGRGYPVKKAEQSGYVPPFLGFRLFDTRKIRVALTLGEPEDLGLDEVKERLYRVFDRDPAFWEAGVGDLEELKSQVRAARNVPELVDILS